MKTCHFETRGGKRIFIPGCIAGAAHGFDKCTCNYRKDKRNRMDILEKRIEKLEKLLLDKQSE